MNYALFHTILGLCCPFPTAESLVVMALADGKRLLTGMEVVVVPMAGHLNEALIGGDAAVDPLVTGGRAGARWKELSCPSC